MTDYSEIFRRLRLRSTALSCFTHLMFNSPGPVESRKLYPCAGVAPLQSRKLKTGEDERARSRCGPAADPAHHGWAGSASRRQTVSSCAVYSHACASCAH